jgi:hypothetical protein
MPISTYVKLSSLGPGRPPNNPSQKEISRVDRRTKRTFLYRLRVEGRVVAKDIAQAAWLNRYISGSRKFAHTKPTVGSFKRFVAVGVSENGLDGCGDVQFRHEEEPFSNRSDAGTDSPYCFKRWWMYGRLCVFSLPLRRGRVTRIR